jgi:hypothetical protein
MPQEEVPSFCRAEGVEKYSLSPKKNLDRM